MSVGCEKLVNNGDDTIKPLAWLDFVASIHEPLTSKWNTPALFKCLMIEMRIQFFTIIFTTIFHLQFLFVSTQPRILRCLCNLNVFYLLKKKVVHIPHIKLNVEQQCRSDMDVMEHIISL